MYAVVIFLLFWALFQIILCETSCSESAPRAPILYILQTKDSIHIEKNKYFTETLKEIGWFSEHYIILENCSTSLATTMEDTKNLRLLVNLHVQDFYNTNYNDVKKNNLIWAGDIGQGTEQHICKSREKKEIRILPNNEKGPIEICRHEIVLQKYAKLVSEEVTSKEILFNFILNFEYPLKNETNKQNRIKKIVICHNSSLYLNQYNEILRFHDMTISISFLSSKCNMQSGTIPPFNRTVIAVLAPNPEWIQETNKPVIFFEEQYVSVEGMEFYQNAMTRQPKSLRQLANTFIRFIRQMKWNRVAILSDDSLVSESFEKELRSLFDLHKISYTVRSVGQTNKVYNFFEALDSLKKVEARIIIANVDECRAALLATQAKLREMTFFQNIVWLARNWSNKTAKIASKELHAVFSVSPRYTPLNDHIAAIRRVINNNRANRNYDYNNERLFASDIRHELTWTDETNTDIIKTDGNGYESILISYNQRVPTIRARFSLPSDRKGQCTLKSNNYNEPCNDIKLIIFMLIIVAFAVTVLGITYFFHIPDSTYNRMQ